MLSLPLSELKPEYDVLVVGSGYGGAISASRLARARKPNGEPVRVCLLERGKELPVGRFPDRPAEALEHFQVTSPEHQLGREDGLYWLHAGADLSVLSGCGLGGTSLINANVCLEPDPRVFEDARWPAALRADVAGPLAAGFEQARAMLRPVPYPEEKRLLKLDALHQAGKRLGAAPDRVYCPPIAVSFEAGRSPAGVPQDACTLCGDCVSGCNVGAKNTLMMNYLPDAKRHGAELFCQVSVRAVEREGESAGWRVYFQPVGAKREGFAGPELFVSAKVVILSAGSVGSSEILLRSAARGLPCSPALGRGFSGNGDVLAFAYNNDVEINGLGAGKRARERGQDVGPCISGIIDLRNTPNVADGLTIEEGSIPGALAGVLAMPMAAVAKVSGIDTEHGFWSDLREKTREWVDVLPGTAHAGAMEHTQTFLVMSHDGADGTVALDNDRVAIRWPGVGERPLFDHVGKALIEATAATGGTFVPSPLFNKAFGYELVTVHALGGCPMGEDAERGATNHFGQVFAAAHGTALHDGLFVADGAILPCSVGVNPLLTISALAERNTRELARARGFVIDEQSAGEASGFSVYFRERDELSLAFTERMAGFCSTARLEPDAYLAAEAEGKAGGSPLEFVLTMSSPDLDRMLEDPTHESGAVGTVVAPALSRAPLTVYGGRFNLFTKDPADARAERMRYRLPLVSVEGKRYFFEGFKLMRDDPGADLWADTTTLYVTIHDGGDATGAVVAKGIVRIAVADFEKQLLSTEARDCLDRPSVRGVERFGAVFAGELWKQYGKIS